MNNNGNNQALENMVDEGTGGSLNSALNLIKRLGVEKGAKALAWIFPKLGNNSYLLKKAGGIGKYFTAKMVQNRYGGKESKEMIENRKYGCSMFMDMIVRDYPRASTNTKEKIADIVFNQQIVQRAKPRQAYIDKFGTKPPHLMILNPTYKCNLKCVGCYAAKYSKGQDMGLEKMNDLIDQGRKEMGMHLITLTGGEPTCWPPLMEMVKDNPDIMFQIYTHGQLIDDKLAGEMADAGNIYPAISLEGTKELTDWRRGQGAYDKVLASMKRLKENGVLFGFSATATRPNSKQIMSEEFVDKMIDQGASFGWYFQYIMTGREPKPELVPTAEQRWERRQDLYTLRQKEKPILTFDFWNDGDLINGCLAFGNRYLNITAEGDVEPCVFMQYTTGNVYEKSLVEIINSPLWQEARSLQPFADKGEEVDLRRPCPIIDHPEVVRGLFKKYEGQVKPSNDGAHRLLYGDLITSVDETSRKFKEYLAGVDAKKCSSCKSCENQVLPDYAVSGR